MEFCSDSFSYFEGVINHVSPKTDLKDYPFVFEFGPVQYSNVIPIELFQKFDLDSQKNIFREKFYAASKAILTESAFHKSKAFAEESEWRMNLTYLAPEGMKCMIKDFNAVNMRLGNVFDKIGYVQSDNALVFHVATKLNNNISQIITGPKSYGLHHRLLSYCKHSFN